MIGWGLDLHCIAFDTQGVFVRDDEIMICAGWCTLRTLHMISGDGRWNSEHALCSECASVEACVATLSSC